MVQSVRCRENRAASKASCLYIAYPKGLWYGGRMVIRNTPVGESVMLEVILMRCNHRRV